MEPTFTHTCHHDRKTTCARCVQRVVEHNAEVQEDELKKELLVMYLRAEHGPKTVHAILGGTEHGLQLYEEIKTEAEKII